MVSYRSCGQEDRGFSDQGGKIDDSTYGIAGYCQHHTDSKHTDAVEQQRRPFGIDRRRRRAAFR